MNFFMVLNNSPATDVANRNAAAARLKETAAVRRSAVRFRRTADVENTVRITDAGLRSRIAAVRRKDAVRYLP